MAPRQNLMLSGVSVTRTASRGRTFRNQEKNSAGESGLAAAIPPHDPDPVAAGATHGFPPARRPPNRSAWFAMTATPSRPRHARRSLGARRSWRRARRRSRRREPASPRRVEAENRRTRCARVCTREPRSSPLDRAMRSLGRGGLAADRSPSRTDCLLERFRAPWAS